MEEQLRLAQGKLAEKQDNLAEEMRKVEVLEREFVDNRLKREKITNEIALCKVKI